MSTEKHIIFREIKGHDGDIGEITLNRPRALNALSLEMCRDLFNKLIEWGSASHIKAVIIKSNHERAFCVGGDIRLLYEHRDVSAEKQMEFFWYEYRLNAAIHYFPKPFIAFLDGMTMGGGAGVSIHGSHRIATERLRFAMPETKIGFFPDIGANYFLNKCPEKMGLYLGLTGNIIDAKESLELGIATHMVQSDCLKKLENHLINTSFRNNDLLSVSEIIQTLSTQPEPSHFYTEKSPVINACFNKNSVEDIIDVLKNNSHEWCHSIANDLEMRSPTSLKVTFEQFKRSKEMNFDKIMQMNFDMTHEFLKQHDFYEGVRAVIIDKDQMPHWQPNNLSDVKDISSYFAPKGKTLMEENSFY